MNLRIEKDCYNALIKLKLVPQEQLEKVFSDSESTKTSFSENLIKLKLVKEEAILDIYSKSLGIPFVDTKSIKIDRSLLEKVPIRFAWYYKFFPLRLQGKKLTVAVSRLLDVSVIDEIRLGLGFDIVLTLATSKEIEVLVKQHYGLGAETVERILAQQSSGSRFPVGSLDEAEEIEDIEKLADSASVVQLVNEIILDAYKSNASDIHIEPSRGRVRLRYRIDGVLHEAAVPADMKKFISSILSRIKLMANLNIVERRLPQDGKARVKTQDQSLDLRISCIPTPQGESMVIRILPSKMIYELSRLGLYNRELEKFRALLKQTEGIVFITGPTGSGKSTTLYAGLKEISAMDRKVITIEDPIEYELVDATQIQVTPDIGLTFAKGLRSMLRHDPDVMMVGEVRDLETADIAIRAALTGHLILSTLHTNDAVGGITRLLDIGVEPYLIASSVIAFTAQRLIRVICPHCKIEDKETSAEIRQMIRKDLSMDADAELRIFKGKGCDDCFQTGYRGRVGIHEFIIMNESIRQEIHARSPANRIKARAMALGMGTLRQDGWRKVIEGITTPDEVIRATTANEEVKEESMTKESQVPETASTSGIRIEKPEKGFHDKRRYDRLAINFPMAYRVIHEQEGQEKKSSPANHPYGRGVTENISAGGVSFVTRDLVKSGSVLEIKLELPDHLEPIQCLGRTLRTLKVLDWVGDAGGYQYRVAVLFLAINSVDRNRIENFCQMTTSIL